MILCAFTTNYNNDFLSIPTHIQGTIDTNENSTRKIYANRLKRCGDMDF